MNEAAKAWVDALRSSRFRQARHALRVLDYDSRLPSLCCLGVACEISGLGEWEKENLFCESGGDSTDDILSRNVANRLGMKTKDGKIILDGTETSLVFLNDKRGKSFAEIADIIETNADQLFVADGQSAGLQPDK